MFRFGRWPLAERQVGGNLDIIKIKSSRTAMLESSGAVKETPEIHTTNKEAPLKGETTNGPCSMQVSAL